MKKTEPTSSAKSVPRAVRVLRGVLIGLLALVLLLAAWLGFSTVNRAKALSVLPTGGGLYLHTESLWNAVNPLMDLQAADLLLSDPAFAQLAHFRSTFMQFRASPLRSNRLVALLASRRVDVALYGGEDGARSFVAAIDMSYLSAFTRTAPLYAALLRVQGLTYVPDSTPSYFYYAADGVELYAKPVKNLLVISSDYKLFKYAVLADNAAFYGQKERALLSERPAQSVRVLADAKQLAALSQAAESPLLGQLLPLLAPDSLTMLSFNITDAEVQVTARVPLSEAAAEQPLLARASTMPPLLARLGDTVQYYTILNAGSLSELKAAVFPYLPLEKDADALWRKADSTCRTLFSLSLDEILFSWSGTEFAAFGIEGQPMPVFAVQVRDEAKRAAIFNKVLASFLIKDDTSLILDGVRLPRIAVPAFIGSLLALFDVAVPAPYYLVSDGYIYFSVAPESLSAVHTAMQSGRRLTKHANWRAVSADQRNEASVSLYYNLERSVPFFLRSDALYAKVLQLYTIGRADLRLRNGEAVIQLHAAARRAGDVRALSGFPMALEGRATSPLVLEPGKNPAVIFWLEDGVNLRSLELSGMERRTFALGDEGMICAASEPVHKTGVVWAVTSQGAVYLLDRTLEMLPAFPVLTGETPAAAPVGYGSSLLIPLQDGNLCQVDGDGRVGIIELPVTGSLRAAPAVLGKTAAVYDKSFLGKLFLIEDGVCTNADSPIAVAGIAFGSPALLKKGASTYMAFVTQAGSLSVWQDGTLASGFPLQLDGVFSKNVVASGSYFYALSEDALLYRIGIDGSVLSVAVPDGTAKNGFLAAAEPNHNGVCNVYVCPDANVIYGFSSNLELLSGFPLAGWGEPVFADANGDRSADCFALTLDNTLAAWNVR